MKTAFHLSLLLWLAATGLGGCAGGEGTKLSAREGGSPQRTDQAATRSPQDLESYKAAALKLHAEATRRGLRRVLSTITLSEPVPTEQTLELIDTYRLDPSFVYSFADAGDGTVATRAAPVDSGTLQERLRSFERPSPRGERFLGVVSMVAMVPVDQVGALQRDKRVFLVDLQADENFTPENRGNREYVHHLAWEIYQNKRDTARGQGR